MDEFHVVDFSFSAVFNEAIEAKQSALKAARDLDRVRVEAEQQITTARAETEGQRPQRETIRSQLL